MMYSKKNDYTKDESITQQPPNVQYNLLQQNWFSNKKQLNNSKNQPVLSNNLSKKQRIIEQSQSACVLLDCYDIIVRLKQNFLKQWQQEGKEN